MMTLHEAIEQVLKEHSRPMTARELADEINRRKLYIKKNESLIEAAQIHARVNKRPQLFDKKDGLIFLKDE